LVPFHSVTDRLEEVKAWMRIERTIEQADDEEEATDNNGNNGVSLVRPTIVGVSAPSEAHQEGNESAKK
jgi:hypothetical protein